MSPFFCSVWIPLIRYQDLTASQMIEPDLRFV